MSYTHKLLREREELPTELRSLARYEEGARRSLLERACEEILRLRRRIEVAGLPEATAMGCYVGNPDCHCPTCHPELYPDERRQAPEDDRRKMIEHQNKSMIHRGR